MIADIDLKSLERKAYFAYHNDGLADAGLGIIFLTFSLGIVWGAPWLAGIIAAAGISSYTALKTLLTVPRIGLVRFSPKREQREVRQRLFFLIYFSFTFLLGIVAFMAFAGGSDNSAGIRAFFEKFPVGIFGLLNAIAIAALGYWQQVSRFYAYAILMVIMVFGGPLLGIPLPIYFGTTGVVMILTGALLLIRFLRAYPLPEEEV